MRKYLYMLIVLALALAGCTKEEYVFKGDNGIFVDGQKVMPLKSAFVGGGIADPKVGASHRFHMYSDHYDVGPRWNEVPSVVTIYGFFPAGTDYKFPGQHLSYIGIDLGGAHGLEELAIKLDQGAYKGSNDLVRSVKIQSYNFGKVDVNGKQIEDAVIDIRIILKDSTVIDIKYKGLTPFDGYY